MTTNEKVLVAMSGGVDSSVAAFLLKSKGYDCMGATMHLFSPSEIGSPAVPSCANPAEADDARRIAQLLEIPFEIIDCAADFRRCVMEYFIRTYQEGGTPNPCVECNRTMKFGKLLECAIERGYPKIATGHYAQIRQDVNGRWQITSATDPSKDQTYVLWSLTQEQLAHTLFPLGEYRKDEIRAIAEENGFCNASRRDSQDICFIPDGDYVKFIQQQTGADFPSGKFVDLDGRILGEHHGAIRYTVGQRKGLGIAFGKPTYVCGKNMAENTVILGSNDDLFHSDLTAHAINLIATDRIDAPMHVQAKVRYNAKPADATVEQLDTDRIRLRFDTPQRAICAGQSVVLYDGNALVGGGIID